MIKCFEFHYLSDYTKIQQGLRVQKEMLNQHFWFIFTKKKSKPLQLDMFLLVHWLNHFARPQNRFVAPA